MTAKNYAVTGAGLGLRRDFIKSIAQEVPASVHFLEVAPENWIGVGGQLRRLFRSTVEQAPLVCHGLSLNLGGQSPLDEVFLKQLRQFLSEYRVPIYSEHLSYCADDGHLYDLLPIPFTEEAVRHVASRIQHVQNVLERRIAIENISYYAAPGKEMSELEFICAVLDMADCQLHLDVNNIYVNSINHNYDAVEFLKNLPAERIAYAHIAGHYVEAEDLRVDTHGADIIESVWQLLGTAYQHFGVFPTLLERDFNIPPLADLLIEVERISVLQAKHTHHQLELEMC